LFGWIIRYSTTKKHTLRKTLAKYWFKVAQWFILSLCQVLGATLHELLQISGFLTVLWFSLPMKLTGMK
jgi:hypothetical protein